MAAATGGILNYGDMVSTLRMSIEKTVFTKELELSLRDVVRH